MAKASEQRIDRLINQSLVVPAVDGGLCAIVPLSQSSLSECQLVTAVLTITGVAEEERRLEQRTGGVSKG